MIHNLSQLKKALKAGARFEITAHCRPECVGQLREVSLANTQGFYSIVVNEPENEANQGNGGRGPVLWWRKALNWTFDGGLCSMYDTPEHKEEGLVLSFRVLEE